ncbi:MAG: DUF2281 domain-containing protein [Cyanobacteriota bacterium]|nr:DUF2281 domain-containing protein [Cyanobacteriota bacterium]
MTSQTIDIVEDLLEKLQKLLPEKQEQVLAFVEFLLFQQNQSTQGSGLAEVAPLATEQRVFGQYRGQIWMSEDFNEPLPDEFWLGES